VIAGNTSVTYGKATLWCFPALLFTRSTPSVVDGFAIVIVVSLEQ